MDLWEVQLPRPLLGSSVSLPDKTNMHTHIPMHTRAFQTNVDTKCDAGPRRVTGLAIEATLYTVKVRRWSPFRTFSAHFVALLGFKDFEDSFSISFGRISHHCAGSGCRRWPWSVLCTWKMWKIGRQVSRLIHVANRSRYLFAFLKSLNFSREISAHAGHCELMPR